MQNELQNKVFHDADKARHWLERHLWPDGPVCGYCGTVNHATAIETRPGYFQCNAKECRSQFTVMVGTVFERSHIPLNKWLMASFLICASKKGMSAHQMHRMLGVSYKSTWFMLHRLREAMRPAKYPGPLGGKFKIVEVDESYIGGKATNRKSRKVREKQAIVALVQRGADVRTFPIKKVNSRTLNSLLRHQVSKKSYLMTDDSNIYPKIGKKFMRHFAVNHSIEEYVRGDAHVNTAENYFSILKRGINGVYHHVSHEHLPMYLAEFDFRYNARSGLGVNDPQRAEKLLKGIVGKRLTYRRPDETEQPWAEGEALSRLAQAQGREAMTDTKYFKVSVALEGESQLFHCTAVEIEGRIWLVPNWIVSPDGKSARPERIILLEQFQAQKIDPPGPFGENFAVNIPIPRALFDGPIPQKLKEKYVVEEQPDITFYDGETRH